MKTTLFALLVLLIASCEKNDPGPAPKNIKGKVTMDVLKDGNTSHIVYEETIGYTFRRSPGTTDTTGLFDFLFNTGFSASGNNYKQLSFAIDSLVNKGLYNFGPNTAAGHAGFAYREMDNAAGTEIDYNSRDDIPNGYITIDSLTHDYIKGTFEVTCWYGSSSVVISNGNFEGIIYY